MAAVLASYRTLWALLATCWLLLCCCHGADAAFTSPYILVPTPAMVASPAPRLEIRDLLRDKYQATLFIRTLIQLQVRPVLRLDSYTRMASIHGSRGTFDGVTQGVNSGGGYCQHSNLVFAPWHRPYLMMFEQALYEQANTFATQYTTADRASYVAAAKALRVPYWDWGLAGGEVPSIFLQRTYDVTLPNGTISTIQNPLRSYTIPADAVSLFNLADRTIIRSWTGTTATLGNIDSLRTGLVTLFKTKDFSCFSLSVSAGCTNTDTLEGLHGRMHVTIGGPGQMRRVPVAAFDPIFFLHHANVDRQLAIWEGINPNTTFPSIVSTRSYPFRKSSNTWWTTRDLMTVYDTSTPKRGSRRFGYYYPEFADPAVTPAQLLAKVDQLYNDDTTGQGRIVVTLASPSNSPVDGTATISLVPATTTGSNNNSAAVVPAGSFPVLTAGSRLSSFTVSRVNVDVTGALAQLKAANPGVTKVDIIANVTPFTSNTTAISTPNATSGQTLNLGTPSISTVVDGQIVSTVVNGKPVTTFTTVLRISDPLAADVKLLQGVGDVKAVVQP